MFKMFINNNNTSKLYITEYNLIHRRPQYGLLKIDNIMTRKSNTFSTITTT